MRVYDAHINVSVNTAGTPFTVDTRRSKGKATIFQATISGTATVTVKGRNSSIEDWTTLATFTATGAKLIQPMSWMVVDITDVSGTPSVTASGAYAPGVPTATTPAPTAPEVDVRGNGVSIASGDATPTTDDHTDFGTTTTGGATISRTFTVRNIGTAPLTISGLSVPSGYTVADGITTPIAPGAEDTFTVRLDVASGGTKSGNVSFSTNDGDEGTYSFAITGAVTALTPPTVALTAPADAGTSTSVPVTVSGTATANAPASSITSVSFYANDILIGTDTVAPYSVSWSPPNGTYTLKMVATDDLGSTTTSATRTHTVNATVTSEPAPMYLEMWDHSVPASPTLVGTMSFIGADTTMAFSDADINAELGTVPVKSASTMSWGGFDWGALRFTCPGGVNATTPGKAFHQVIVFNKPNTNWANYPAASGYNKDVSETHPPAFKVIMKDTGGNVLHTWEMYDGLPINSWDINVGYQYPAGGAYTDAFLDDTKAIRFHLNCAQVLPWTQARCKQNAKAKWWYGGVTSYNLHGSVCTKTYSTNPSFPPGGFGANGGGQSNGVFNHRFMPFRPRAANHPFYTDPSTDEYMNSWWNFYPAQNQGRTGHGYEPGNPGHIDMNTALGGVRFDRGGFATPIVEVISDPAKVHGMTQKTYRELLDHTMLNCFNIAFHYTGNVATGGPALDKTNTFLCGPNGSAGSATAWGYGKGYYLSQPSYVAGGLSHTIHQMGMGQGAFDSNNPDNAMRFYKRDAATGKIRRPFSGWCTDHMHAHQFWGACAGLFNSPMHAWHNVHALNACMLTNNNQSYDNHGSVRPIGWWANSEFSYSGVLTRERAYRLMHLAMGWWLANNHPSFGLSRTDLQQELVRYIKTYHTGVYQKKWAAGSDNSPYWLGLRRFGMQLTPRLGSNYASNPTHYYARLEDTPAGCYHIYPFTLMTQTGLMDYLLGLGDTQITESLNDMVLTLDTFSVDGILDAGYVQSQDITHRMSPIFSSFAEITAASIPLNWAGLSAVAPPIGSTAFLKDSTGAWKEYSAWAHIQGMWAVGAHHYLRGHFPNARSSAAFTFITNTYNDHLNNYVLANPDKIQQGFRGWTYFHPVHGHMVAPTP